MLFPLKPQTFSTFLLNSSACECHAQTQGNSTGATQLVLTSHRVPCCRRDFWQRFVRCHYLKLTRRLLNCFRSLLPTKDSNLAGLPSLASPLFTSLIVHHRLLPTTTSHELEYLRCLDHHFRILPLPQSLQEAGLRAALT